MVCNQSHIMSHGVYVYVMCISLISYYILHMTYLKQWSSCSLQHITQHHIIHRIHKVGPRGDEGIFGGGDATITLSLEFRKWCW